MNIIQKVTKIEDAYEIEGVTVQEVIPFPDPKNDDQTAINAFAQAVLLTRVLNEGRVPDFDNYDQRKWEIWWDMRSESAGGPGFSLFNVDYYHSSSLVGARLVFLDKEVARYAATQFVDIYKSFLGPIGK